MKNLIFFSFAVLLSGCFTTVPRKWSTPQEAFPGGVVVDASNSGNVALRQSLMNFSFADVFASSEKAMSFAQINITESVESSGIIYGTRSMLVRSSTKKYYYMIKITEESAERCNVAVYSKQQQGGNHMKWLHFVVLPWVGTTVFLVAMMPDYAVGSVIGSLAIPVILSPFTLIMNKIADKNAALKWSPDDDEYLDRIMSFIRTDLLQR